MMEPNLAEVVAEVAAVFDDYEAALRASDADRLNELFWDSPLTVRFGVADAQIGHEALARWRSAQPALPPGRTLADTRVLTFGSDIAVVTTTFSYPSSSMIGRQSQTWVRLPVGWRIVDAHVSELPAGP